jgi:hypothetical protein
LVLQLASLPKKKANAKTHTFSKQIVNKKRQSGFLNNQIIDMNAIFA